MSKGRKPLPTNLKVLKGTDRKCRINADEPRPDADKIRMPAGLSDSAKRQWRMVSRQLKDAGIITNIDVSALAMYCEAYATWMDAQHNLQKYGAVVKNAQGLPVVSPFFKVSDKAFQQVRAMLIEFGMTPSSRTKVSAATEKEDEAADPFARLSAVK